MNDMRYIYNFYMHFTECSRSLKLRNDLFHEQVVILSKRRKRQYSVVLRSVLSSNNKVDDFFYN